MFDLDRAERRVRRALGIVHPIRLRTPRNRKSGTERGRDRGAARRHERDANHPRESDGDRRPRRSGRASSRQRRFFGDGVVHDDAIGDSFVRRVASRNVVRGERILAWGGFSRGGVEGLAVGVEGLATSPDPLRKYSMHTSESARVLTISPFRNTHAFALLAPSLECARTRLLRCARESVPPTRLDGEYKAIQ